MAIVPSRPPAAVGATVRVTAALEALARAVDAPRQSGIQLGNWRWVVRRRLAALRDALVQETTASDDGWLAARGGAAYRERTALLMRLGGLTSAVLTTEAVEDVRVDLKRLLADVGRHVQHLHDLAYDEVGLELGGSE